MVPRPRKREPTRSAEIDPKFRSVVDAFDNQKDVSGGKLMSSFGLKVNGKIFAMFGKKQFVTKLPKLRVDELVELGIGKHFDPGGGRIMKEWIVVGEGKIDWIELAKEAYAFVKRTNS